MRRTLVAAITLLTSAALVGGAAVADASAARPARAPQEHFRIISTITGSRRQSLLATGSFTAGGYRYSGTLDHTSVLRFIETRFGVTVPNLSAWRRSVTGDFTGALNLSATPVTAFPSLPIASLGDTSVAEQAVLNALAGTEDVGIPYPLPTSNSMPSQETTPSRPEVP